MPRAWTGQSHEFPLIALTASVFHVPTKGTLFPRTVGVIAECACLINARAAPHLQGRRIGVLGRELSRPVLSLAGAGSSRLVSTEFVGPTPGPRIGALSNNADDWPAGRAFWLPVSLF